VDRYAPRTAARGYLPRSAFPQLARPISHTQITRVRSPVPPPLPSVLVIYALEPSFSALLAVLPRSADRLPALASHLYDNSAAPRRSLIYVRRSGGRGRTLLIPRGRARIPARRRAGLPFPSARNYFEKKRDRFLARARARARRGRGLILESFVRPGRPAVKSRETRGNIARPVYLLVTLFWYFVTRARPIRSVE